MRQPSPPVLDGISRRTRLRSFAALCVALSLAFGASRVMAVDTAWVHQFEISGLVNSDDAENYAAPLASCGLAAAVADGFDPAWIRVGGNTNPHTPIIEAAGQILDPHDYVAPLGDDAKPFATKTNAFVNYTDAPFNHYARDVNTFLTLDPEYRHFLSTGSFGEGDSNERGNFEIEWERGSIPMYAFPAIGDRLRVWGAHVFDCGHGDTWAIGRDDDDNYRTEIHSPFGWVVYRQTADADGIPNGKQNNSPWQWYANDDLQGMAVTLPTTGLLFTPVQATVADAYFSSFGGNVVESINGCDEDDDQVPCYGPEFDGDIVRPELNGDQSVIHSWEWQQPILDQDYEFVVPAPPMPAGAPADTRMIFEMEDRCADVPVDPTIPNKHDHKEALDEVEGIDPFTTYSKDWPIGAARCNHAPTNEAPYTVDVDRSTVAPFAAWNNTNRPAIRVTVRAKTGHDGIDGTADDPLYPSNDYISFAYRVKVAWDYAPPAANRARNFRADFDTLRVYDDGEDCGDDGEWVMTLRVNDQTIHPVEGTAPDDIDADDITEPFWENDVIDDAKCGGSGDYKSYEMGSKGASVLSRFFTALPGVPIEVWDRTYEKDHLSPDDLAPVFRQFYAQPAPGGTSSGLVIGTTNPDIEVAHTVIFSITDVSNLIPGNGTASVGVPQYGPNANTGGRYRVTGSTPITISGPAEATGLEWRVWDPENLSDGPSQWQYDVNAGDGLVVDLPDTGSGVFVLEWATIAGTGIAATVSERSRMEIELDNTPPALTMPADASVYANSTAGANLGFDATAEDDLPGPVQVNCVPPSGTIFPNGANSPLTTTVTCTASDSLGNEATDTFNVTVTSPHGYINDYALLGLESLDVDHDASITGSIGVFDQSAGLNGQPPGIELRLDNNGIIASPWNVAAHSVKLGGGVLAGDVFSTTPIIAGPKSTYTAKTACGAGPATLDKCAYVPLWSALPAFISAAAPGANQLINGGFVTVAPGNYGDLVVKGKGTVQLVAGTYSFSRIELGPNTKIVYTSPATTVRVAGRVDVKGGSSILAAVGGAPYLRLYVGGVDEKPNKSAMDIDPGAIIGANVYVPNGTLSVGSKSSLAGAFIGRRVKLGSNVTVTKDSLFIQ